MRAILLAAGDGNRFGGEVPKQFLRLAGEEVSDVALVRSASRIFDPVVVEAVRTWRYKPRLVDGHARDSMRPSQAAPARPSSQEARRRGTRNVSWKPPRPFEPIVQFL